MAVIEGTQGNVTLPTGHNAKIGHFTAVTGQGDIDITGFDSAGWMEFLGTIKSLRGSASGRMKYGATSTSPGFDALSKTGGSMTLTMATGCTFTFTALVSDIEVVEDAHGEAAITFNFKSTGAVTVAWAEA